MKKFWSKLLIIVGVIALFLWVLVKFIAPKLGASFASGTANELSSRSWKDLLKSGVASLASSLGSMFSNALNNEDSGLANSKIGQFYAKWLKV